MEYSSLINECSMVILRREHFDHTNEIYIHEPECSIKNQGSYPRSRVVFVPIMCFLQKIITRFPIKSVNATEIRSAAQKSYTVYISCNSLQRAA